MTLEQAWLSQKSWMYELMWSTRMRHQLQEPACGRMRRRTLPLRADRNISCRKSMLLGGSCTSAWSPWHRLDLYVPTQSHHGLTSPKRLETAQQADTLLDGPAGESHAAKTCDQQGHAWLSHHSLKLHVYDLWLTRSLPDMFKTIKRIICFWSKKFSELVILTNSKSTSVPSLWIIQNIRKMFVKKISKV